MVITSVIRAISSQAPKGMLTYGEGSEIAWLGGRLQDEVCLRYDPSAAKAGRLIGVGKGRCDVSTWCYSICIVGWLAVWGLLLKYPKLGLTQAGSDPRP
jgi:hypothetical protein